MKILAGKDRGKTGKVLRVDLKNGLVLVEGANMKKRHVRPKRQDKKGEIVLVAASLPASKVMLMCPNCKKSARVGWTAAENKKIRTCKKCGQEI